MPPPFQVQTPYRSRAKSATSVPTVHINGLAARYSTSSPAPVGDATNWSHPFSIPRSTTATSPQPFPGTDEHLAGGGWVYPGTEILGNNAQSLALPRINHENASMRPFSPIPGHPDMDSPNSPLDLDDWQMIRSRSAASCTSRAGNYTSSGCSDSLSVDIEHRGCGKCVSKDSELGRLQNYIQNLTQQIGELQQTIRTQHSTIHSQQHIIEKSESSSAARVPERSRKRASPGDQSGHPSMTQPAQISGRAGPATKRAKFGPQQRRQTAETRKQGACVKCWKHKQRCTPGPDMDGPCKNCHSTSLSMIRLPCIRTHIVELTIFRTGTGINDTWTQRDEVEQPTDLSTYCSDERKHLVLTHGFGPELHVKVRRYRPVRDDVTEYEWKDGQGNHRTWPMPPYALCDIDDLASDIKSYIGRHQSAYINGFIHSNDIPTWKAFTIAQQLAASGKSPLLSDVLELWVAARLIERPWQICGEETLGLQTSDHWWWIPVTPIMDSQLDQVVMKKILSHLRKQVLHGLQTHIEKACRTNWLEIIVTIVILLNTIEEATRHDHDFATFFSHEDENGRRRFEDYNLIESYFHSALVLLTHVKVAFDGRLPLLDEKTDVSKLMNICQEEIEEDYMIETDKYIGDRRKKIEFEKIRQQHRYEAPQFWVHQLFLKQWDGRPISIEETI